jgi:hypothetical protein|tara:strand:- start:49 stop:195 length:147 start_codon:yes stop_codon:yes gene_type:complete
MNQEALVVKFGDWKEMIEYQLLLMIIIMMAFLETGSVLGLGLHHGFLL